MLSEMAEVYVDPEVQIQRIREERGNRTQFLITPTTYALAKQTVTVSIERLLNSAEQESQKRKKISHQQKLGNALSSMFDLHPIPERAGAALAIVYDRYSVNAKNGILISRLIDGAVAAVEQGLVLVEDSSDDATTIQGLTGCQIVEYLSLLPDTVQAEK